VYEQPNGFSYLGYGTNDINTGWGQATTGYLDFSCSGRRHRINVFSGNASHIVEAINSLFNPIVSATALNPYFWFYNRQSCKQCGSANEPPCSGPNTRPPYLSGYDSITSSSVIFNPTTQQYVITLRASSQRFTVCASQSAMCLYDPSEYGFGASDTVCPKVVNHCSSLNSLSMPEYAQGFRYIMSGQQLGCGNQEKTIDFFGRCLNPPVIEPVLVQPGITNNPSCVNTVALPDGIEGRRFNPGFVYLSVPYNGYQRCPPACAYESAEYPFDSFCFTKQYPPAFSACDFTAPWPTVEIPNYTFCNSPSTGEPVPVTRYIKYVVDVLACTGSGTPITID
jgi:hypothetical protein